MFKGVVMASQCVSKGSRESLGRFRRSPGRFRSCDFDFGGSEGSPFAFHGVQRNLREFGGI